jgi:hypothetical protein
MKSDHLNRHFFMGTQHTERIFCVDKVEHAY